MKQAAFESYAAQTKDAACGISNNATNTTQLISAAPAVASPLLANTVAAPPPDPDTKLTNIGNSLIPLKNEKYDLGSPSMRFRYLYLSEDTIHVGNGKISFNPDDSKFKFLSAADSSVAGVSLDSNTTDDLAEGTTNFYWTDERANTKISIDEKGVADGVCPLNNNAKIDLVYLPNDLISAISALTNAINSLTERVTALEK